MLSDGTLATLTGSYTCKIKVAGAGIERAVSDKNGENTRFIAALTPSETTTLDAGQYVLAIEIENATLTPPLRLETHIILTVQEQIIGSDYVPSTTVETEVERITRELSEARAARAALMNGETVQEMWRDGRRIIKKLPSLSEINATILTLERELADATSVAAGRPKRRAIGVYF
jgi:hypothetical protein